MQERVRRNLRGLWYTETKNFLSVVRVAGSRFYVGDSIDFSLRSGGCFSFGWRLFPSVVFYVNFVPVLLQATFLQSGVGVRTSCVFVGAESE